MWALLFQCATILKHALLVLVLPAAIFAGLAIVTKGLYPALGAVKRAIHETRNNLTLYILDSLIMGPILAIVYGLTTNLADAFSLRMINPHSWNNLPSLIVAFFAIFVGDFIGYWRHRLEHTRFLWPSHAVHHSDTAMTWLTLLRFHPINRLSTFVIDIFGLVLLGLPAYALLAYAVVKHYYGFFIHADLAWSYGRLEPIQEVRIQIERHGLVKRRSMMRIMARRMKAATVVA
jgi:sterol desaturase/sphingolipid hydroxylase (fatty acid hydroxylase superfamily)